MALRVELLDGLHEWHAEVLPYLQAPYKRGYGHLVDTLLKDNISS